MSKKLFELYDFENRNEMSLEEYVENFKKFCHYFEINYSEQDIEKLKDIYAFNKLEMKNQAEEIIEELKEELI